MSGNAYAELLKLICLEKDKTMITNILIDMSGKVIASVQGYEANVEVTPNKFFIKSSFANIDVFYYIDRNSSIYNEAWFNKTTREARYYNGKCLEVDINFDYKEEVELAPKD